MDAISCKRWKNIINKSVDFGESQFCFDCLHVIAINFFLFFYRIMIVVDFFELFDILENFLFILLRFFQKKMGSFGFVLFFLFAHFFRHTVELIRV
jgi:hypothetical protein